MQALPVITGFGGYNAAGRSSFYQSYRRMIFASLSGPEQQKTLVGLACLMKLVTAEGGKYRTAQGGHLTAEQVAEVYRQQVLDGSLVRRIEKSYFDVDNTPWQPALDVTSSADTPMTFTVNKRQLPEKIPEGWQVVELPGRIFRVTLPQQQKLLFPGVREFKVKSAGQLPSGFNPGDYYNTHFQPRGLQLAVLGASDAVRSLGMPWEKILSTVKPDQIGVYASSCFGQMNEEGFGGLFRARAQGGRPTSKQVPLSMNSMPADFVNAYVLGNIGHTEAVSGACATFLYNLRSAICDIQSGRRRVAMVGDAEAPIEADAIEGFANMGALATDDGLCKLDGVTTPDWRRASRPFGDNCGFAMGESSQYIVLMDDALAMELGADIFGAATDVFINADGVKKSISSPGAGNLISFAKAVSAARALLGPEAVASRSMVQAHGSGTPQNRVTESYIFDRVAEVFGIENWPVTAMKAYLGHTMATASGDQVVASLGVFRHGIIPGIKTVERVADDVHQKHLRFLLDDLDCREQGIDISFVNAKGFGGNNATGVLVSPRVVEQLLQKRYGADWDDYLVRRDTTREAAKEYEVAADRAELNPFYRFGEPSIPEEEVEISTTEIKIPGYENAIELPCESPYKELL